MLEIGGDALSKALADAISQLTTSDQMEETEPEPNQKSTKEDKKKKKDKDKEKEKEKENKKSTYQTGFGQMPKSSSSMDLSNFDSLAELAQDKKGIEPKSKSEKSKLAQLDPNDEKSLENLFSSALSDLSNAFGMADVPSSSESDKKNKDSKKKKK